MSRSCGGCSRRTSPRRRWHVSSASSASRRCVVVPYVTAVVLTVSHVSILQSIPSFVRFYRDYSIADFAFMTVSTLVVSYTSYSNKYVRTGVCEELSRHPDLMRDMVEMGLNVENCELWFERAVVGIIGIMFILIVIRVRAPSGPPQRQLVYLT